MRSIDLSTALASCSYYPVAVDLGRRLIWFAEIDREVYRTAGFLIPKQARMSEERYGFNLEDVLLHDLSLPIGGAPSHYIFISAFCCSMLLARLLERVPGCFVLKEPSILGQLAMLRYRPRKSAATPSVVPAEAGIQSDDGGRSPLSRGRRTVSGTTVECSCSAASGDAWEQEWQTWAGLGMRLLTRTFEPEQTVIVKASDTCNTMGEVILANDPRSKVVLLSVNLRTFILSVLKLEDRRDWTRKRANFWHKTLTLLPALSAVKVPELDDAQKSAYLWLVTAALWDRFRKQVEPERLLLMDGERVSESPSGALRELAAFFGLALEENRVEEILADPVLNRHSKIPGQTYSAAQRRNDLVDWEARFGADADRAMEWAAPIRTAMEANGIDFSAMAGSEVRECSVQTRSQPAEVEESKAVIHA